MNVPTLPLTAGIQIPQIGFGTSGLRSATEAILQALQAGYRHLDTADIYGTHGNIAQAIPRSGVKREDIFITTKLWKQDLPGDKVRAAVDRFLRELNTDYLDLLLIHWPAGTAPVAETLAAMDKVRQAGKVRAIGVSNFDVALIKEALATGLPVCNDQIEFNLNHRPQGVLDYCLQHKVTVTAYSPLEADSGRSRGLLAQLAKQHSATREQVLLAWLMKKGMIVIPRSSEPKHIEANLHSLEVSLSDEDVEKLDTLK